MITPRKEFRDAVGVLNRYYNDLAGQMAEEIIEHAEDFDLPGIGQADSVIEKYARRLYELGAVYGFLRWAAFRQKPQGKEPLARDEFRCFGCGAVIRKDDQACQACGWTWR
jgi:hypothetical protein